MIDLVALQGWLERYEHAWRSNDPAEIGDLFTTDAVYRWHPWDTPADGGAGRTEIVEAWLTDPDEPGTWTLECEPLAVSGRSRDRPLHCPLSGQSESAEADHLPQHLADQV